MKSLSIRVAIVLMSMWLLFAGLLTTILIATGSVLLVGLVGVVASIVVYTSQSITHRAVGAEEATPDEYPELHNRVGRLAHQTELPQPDIAVVDTTAPNAFVTGWGHDYATLTVTRGLLNTLDGDELDAVLAHELAHIRNNDLAVMMLGTTIATIAYSIVRWGWLANDNGDQYWVVVLVMSLVTWIGTYLLMRLLSRYREYLADDAATSLTGNPHALASALRRIDNAVDDIPDDDLRQVASTNSMNFYEVETMASHLVRTHPPTEERIERIQS